MTKTISDVARIARIKEDAARVKADQAYDRKKGIKQGSAADKKIDAKTKVSKLEYGKKY